MQGYIKQKSTFYTAEKTEAAKENILTFDWAKKEAKKAVDRADLFLTFGEDRLWDLVTAQNLPRSYAVNQEMGCPVCKSGLHAYGRWPYLADVKNQPWKIQCPSCHTLFPGNDFGAYYQSGLDGKGEFQPDMADRSLLTNTLYADKGADWFVDDGYGWIDENGNRYTFIAFYNHWKIWIDMIDAGGNVFPKEGYPFGHGGIIHNALSTFKDAWLYTGNPTYARAGLILLDRIADVFPSMDSSVYRWNEGFRNSHGGSGLGKITGNIWDTGLCQTFAEAYDAFFPVIETCGAIDFLKQKALRWPMLPSKNNAADLCRNIEKNLLQEIFIGVKNCQIRGNNGSHQSTLAMTAMVADDPSTTPVMLDFIFKTHKQDVAGRLNGGSIAKSLVDDIDRDGFGNEAAPSYNNIWVQSFANIADILQGTGAKWDLYRHPKFLKMLEAHVYLMMCGKYTVTIGDSASTGNPHLVGNMATAITAFNQTQNPVFAYMAWLLSGKKEALLHADILTKNPESIQEAVCNFLSEGRFDQFRNKHLSGYGFTALQDGEGEFERDMWLYMGRNTGHGHKDSLVLGLHAFGVDMAPDLGYPEQCDHVYQKTHHFDKHTVCHNTVMVNETPQSPNLVGQTIHFNVNNQIKWIEAAAPSAYPSTTLYRRCSALIKIDASHSYILDLFYVKGGSRHHYIFHGAEGPAALKGVETKKQSQGTYAGENVPYGVAYDAEPGKPLVAYNGSGFHYLNNVERAACPGHPIQVVWSVHDTWHVGPADLDRNLSMTLLEDCSEVALADGIPSQNRPGNPKSLRYLLVKREGSNLESLFTSIIEPFNTIRRVLSIEKQTVASPDGSLVNEKDQTAVKVTLDTGEIHTIMHALNPNQAYVVGENLVFQGAFAFIITKDEQVRYAHLCEGTRLSYNGKTLLETNPAITGHILNFTEGLSIENKLTIKTDSPMNVTGEQLKGHIVRVANTTGRNPVYEILDARKIDDVTWQLSVGNTGFVQCYLDPHDFEMGFKYDIQKGDAFTIPLSVEYFCNAKSV